MHNKNSKDTLLNDGQLQVMNGLFYGFEYNIIDELKKNTPITTTKKN